MLEKFLNKNVLICFANYASATEVTPSFSNPYSAVQRKGIVTNIDNNFIELDNDEVVAIKYIATIKSI